MCGDTPISLLLVHLHLKELWSMSLVNQDHYEAIWAHSRYLLTPSLLVVCAKDEPSARRPYIGWSRIVLSENPNPAHFLSECWRVIGHQWQDSTLVIKAQETTGIICWLKIRRASGISSYFIEQDFAQWSYNKFYCWNWSELESQIWEQYSTLNIELLSYLICFNWEEQPQIVKWCNSTSFSLKTYSSCRDLRIWLINFVLSYKVFRELGLVELSLTIGVLYFLSDIHALLQELFF